MSVVIYMNFYNLAHSLPEMTKLLLSDKNVQFVLTERFNQDPIEIYFGQQRARGQRNDNPSVSQFLENAQAIVVQKTLVTGGSSCINHKREGLELSPLCQPLPKRKCIRKLKL